MKFQPGSFLEVEDFQGARKVVLVGRDGVTCWDSIRTDHVTPLVIHPAMQPEALGNLVSFVQAGGLQPAALKVLDLLRARGEGREQDSLFVMRVLWSLAQNIGPGRDPDDATLQLACTRAEAQETLAHRLHAQAREYQAGLKPPP